MTVQKHACQMTVQKAALVVSCAPDLMPEWTRGIVGNRGLGKSAASYKLACALCVAAACVVQLPNKGTSIVVDHPQEEGAKKKSSCCSS